MKVKLLVSRAGVSFSQSPGDIVDVSENEGPRMIAAGQAVLHEEITDAVIHRGETIETTSKKRTKAERAVK